jgi:phosphoenolpyruvate synthase/pyruvate phosphate dikinase
VSNPGIRTFGQSEITGKLALSAKTAKLYSRKKSPFIYLSKMTEPSDVPIMEKAAAVATIDGGPSCHAAIICNMQGIPCITSLQSISFSKIPIGNKNDPYKECYYYSVEAEGTNYELVEGSFAQLRDNILTLEVTKNE